MVKTLTRSQGYSPRVESRRSRARAEIVEAARAVLLEEGPTALTIDAVAQRAAISKPSVYYYFRGKDELLEAVVLAILDAQLDACEAAIASTTTGADATVASLRATVAFYAADPDAARVMFGHLQAVGMRGETTEVRANPRLNAIFDAIVSRIEADQAAGRVSRGVPARRAAVMAHMLATGVAWTWSLLARVGTTSRHGLDELLDEAERTLRAALPPPVRRRSRA